MNLYHYLLPDSGHGEVIIYGPGRRNPNRVYSAWLGLSQGTLLIPIHIVKGLAKVGRDVLPGTLRTLWWALLSVLSVFAGLFLWGIVSPVAAMVLTIWMGFCGKMGTVDDAEEGDEDYGELIDFARE